MIRKLITTDDFVTTKQTYTRFGEKVECKPIVTYFRAGLLKDYKNLNTDAEVLFFDGREVANDAGQGMYRKVYTKHTEDIGVYIKVGNHFYKRQYTGAVNLGWFGDDTNAIRTALKYGFIRFEQKTYNLDYDIYSLTNNVKIDLNGATIIIKGTPIYGFFFRVNDYILKIMNGTIKAHSGITNIARFTNASAITTDFRTNIKFLDLEGNQFDLHQLPNTNEILYRGVNSRLDINGRKHFTSTDGSRTLRIKEGIAAPTDDNQLVPATYESEEFDYSSLVKSNVNTTINGVKIFTDFVYNADCISIYDAPVTTTAIEYYLQVFKTQIETQIGILFIANNYFKLNAYYISCDIYKEVDSTITIDEDNTSDINLLFDYTRFVTFKNANNYSEFNTYKYKWKINKRTYFKDNYIIKFVIQNMYRDEVALCITDIPAMEQLDVKFTAQCIYYSNGYFTATRNLSIKNTYIINGYYVYQITMPSITLKDYLQQLMYTIQGKTVVGTMIYFYYAWDSMLQQDLIFADVYRRFYRISRSSSASGIYTTQPYLTFIYYHITNLKHMYIRLKSDAFSNDTIYMSYVTPYNRCKIQGNFTLNILSYTFVDVTILASNKTYSIFSTYADLESRDIQYIYNGLNNGTLVYTDPDSIFVGNLTTGEAILEEPILDNPILHNKKHKFIKMDLQNTIGVAYIYNNLNYQDRPGYKYGYGYYTMHETYKCNIKEILQYFDVILLPTDKTLDDYTLAELENMIINPT